MNCRECQNLLPEFSIGVLDPQAQQQVATHLSNGCDTCQLQLQALTETWASLPSTLPATDPPDSLRRELLARVRADESPLLTSETEAIPIATLRSETTFVRVSVAVLPYLAASLIGIVAGYWFSGERMPRNDFFQQYQAHISESERLFGKDQVYLASLQFSNPQSRGGGHLVWDSSADQLHCYTFNLGELADESVFRLWFVASEDEWYPVGDLEAQPDGIGIAVLPRPQLTKKWARAVVTMEPQGPITASTKPQGPIQLSGDLR